MSQVFSSLWKGSHDGVLQLLLLGFQTHRIVLRTEQTFEHWIRVRPQTKENEDRQLGPLEGTRVQWLKLLLSEETT
jgi:hypothetical protein